jgi:hypothetical protein
MHLLHADLEKAAQPIPNTALLKMPDTDRIASLAELHPTKCAPRFK